MTAASDAHGFVLRSGASRPLTRIEVPGAVSGTAVFDITDSGQVVGIYGNPNTASGLAKWTSRLALGGMSRPWRQ